MVLMRMGLESMVLMRTDLESMILMKDGSRINGIDEG